MHEMALMADIIQLVIEDAHTKGLNKINQIELVVGEIASAMPDALTMAFSIYKEQSPELFETEANLVIHHEAALAECILCGLRYKPSFKVALCPSCRAPSGKIIAGEAFQVLSYEGG
ncbi:hydrogenase nickel incorporation protein HypA [Bacillus sp. B-jedd]|nr:hydrogenase nickel incorporation protein HypA [Bacillus sp. B-jedd]